jgi:hypothetical protein
VPTERPSEPATRQTLRGGQLSEVDAAFDAWTSGDLDTMIAALDSRTNPIDRHFLLMSIVDRTYKARKQSPDMVRICKQVAARHLQELPAIAPALVKDLGVMPRVSTFRNYAIVLAEDGNFAGAISVCEQALRFSQGDGTKSGFPGRIRRLRKAMEAAAAR